MFTVVTDYPVALESNDHTTPHGTANDNSRWPEFNRKLYKLYNTDQISVLDLGCAGGGFVKDCLDDGHLAVGLEGSDYSKNMNRAEWAKIPNNLFTCDITKPYQVLYNDLPVEFDAITGWELLEHIPEPDLDEMITQFKKHLSPKGLAIFSISPNQEFWHVCVHDREWWLSRFLKHNLICREVLVGYFDPDWIRGPLQEAPNSFHVVLQKG